jgi:O-antigen/teichoic acid export membrane protein
MKIGQTTAIHFGSKVLASVLGFTATLAIARLLGAGPLGTYSSVLAVVAWLAMANNLGVGDALEKRVSEGTDRGQFVVAAVLAGGGLFTAISVVVLVLSGPLNAYLGTQAARFVILLLFASVSTAYGFSTLNGLRLVHLSGLLSPVKTFLRAGLQIALLLAGLQLAGLFAGYAVAYVAVATLCAGIAYRHLGSVTLPRREHFRSLLDYARFSWVSGLDKRTYGSMDILVLNYFVAPSLVGIYAAAWSFSQFLSMFNSSVTSTLFPEMSNVAETDGRGAVADLFEDGLAYTGLFVIPGLVGGALLGGELLTVYGQEFAAGAVVFTILIAATLLEGYRKLFVTALNAVDRPDLTFRVNFLFMGTNVAANVVLVSQVGWTGAAVATAGSVAVGLAYAYRLTSSLLQFSIPAREIGRQTFAALVMGAVVLLGRYAEKTYAFLGHDFVSVLVLVGIGAATYFAVLFLISARFRKTVLDNAPGVNRPAR